MERGFGMAGFQPCCFALTTALTWGATAFAAASRESELSRAANESIPAISEKVTTAAIAKAKARGAKDLDMAGSLGGWWAANHAAMKPL
jgi:hypothetical protein